MKSIQILGVMLALATGGFLAAAPAPDAAAVDQAFHRLAQYQYGDDYLELAPIERAVSASHQNESLRAELEQRFLDVITGPAPNAAKDYACRALSLIGTAESVPPLAALLSDPELGGLARYALERIPDPAVDQALLAALDHTSGRLKAGVINSIGLRRDTEAVATLAGVLKQQDPIVVEAALLALGKIATIESARILGQFRTVGPETLRDTADAAFLEAADLLLQDGQAETAARVFEQLYRDHAVGALHLAGFQGLVLARPGEANRRLLAALSAENLPVRHLAARLVAELPGETPRVFLDALAGLPADAQTALLGALHIRGDGAARPAVLPLLQSDDAAVRVAAVDALSTIGAAGDVITLARIAAGAQAGERDAARNSMTLLPGADINHAILGAMEGADPRVKVELLRSLIGRVARETMEPVARHLADSDARVGRAAAEVLSAMGDEGQVSALVSFVIRATAEGQRDAGVRALTSIAGRVGERAVDGLLAGLAEAQPVAQAALFRVLPVTGGERSLAVVRRAMGNPNEVIHDAAVRALIQWREADALPDLLGIIRSTDNPSHRVLAFRGYVRLARELDVAPARRFALIQDVAKLAETAGDKRLVIAALGDIRTIEALQLAAGYLDDAELANEAGAAAVRIAPHLPAADRSGAVGVLQRVISSASAQSILDDAQRVLDRLDR